jgi:hypothetical protein
LHIILLGIAAAVGYGIVHDQITARICVEYFTIGHPDVFGTDDPTLLGLGWGILATWWVGLMLGVALAVAARAGNRPKREARHLVRPVGLLLLISAGFAVLAGLAGYLAASQGWVTLMGPLASQVPQARHIPFLVDLWAHTASYAAALIGGATPVAWTYRTRGRDGPPTGVGDPWGG